MNGISQDTGCKIGVGLRHAHIGQALSSPAAIDFIEVHAENYFAEGGVLHQIIQDVADRYPVSIHATAMGLGSAIAMPEHYLNQLVKLTQIINPFLISDHAAFGWGQISGKTVHGGDLLPIIYNAENLCLMIQRVDQMQQVLGRQLLIENLSAYLSFPENTMNEPEFLARLAQATGCGLLIDLNNILVNEFNNQTLDPLEAGKKWLQIVSSESVGEIHLAGFTKPKPGQLAIDDHGQPVGEDCWELYKHAINYFGPVPTLIEWDNRLPDWNTLVDQTRYARQIMQENLHLEHSQNPTATTTIGDLRLQDQWSIR